MEKTIKENDEWKGAPLSFSPLDLAKCLGVDDDLSDFEGNKSPLWIMELWSDTLKRYWVELGNAQGKRRTIFDTEFFQLYGHIFFRAHIKLGSKAFSTKHGWLWLHYLIWLTKVPCFIRFVRKHPLAPKLFELLIGQSASDLPQWADIKSVIVETSEEVYVASTGYLSLSYILGTLYHIILGSAAADDFAHIIFPPHLPRSIVDGLISRLDEYIAHHSLVKDKVLNLYLGELSRRVSSVMTGQLSPKEMVEQLVEKKESHWFYCDTVVSCSPGSIGLSDDYGPCAESGEPLLICGRCLAVRYCGKFHQKAHWCRHKTFCFKPSW